MEAGSLLTAPEKNGLYITESLNDSICESLDIILQLWEKLQAVSLEAIQLGCEDINVFSFAESCLFFGVINKPWTLDEDRDRTTDCEGSQTTVKQETNNIDLDLDSPWSDDIQGVTGQHRPPPIGLIYCATPVGGVHPAGEISIGIVLHPNFRGKGYGRQAIEKVLKWIFETAQYHRVQAAIIDSEHKDKSIALFTQL
jgi:hypothetical protein